MLAATLYFLAFTSFRLIAIKPWVSGVVSGVGGGRVAQVSEYGGEAGCAREGRKGRSYHRKERGGGGQGFC